MDDDAEFNLNDFREGSVPDEEAGIMYRLTPKGIIALVLLDYFPSLDLEGATPILNEIENKIFEFGWVYYHESQVTVIPEEPPSDL